MLGLKDLHNFHRQAGRVGLPSGSCSSLLQLHAVTGELLSDPGTLVAEVFMIMIFIMYFVYETHGLLTVHCIGVELDSTCCTLSLY